MKRQQMRNLFVAMMISQGTPLMLGGDEWMRTQYGNNNAYSTWADNEWNWFRWGEWRNVTAPHRHRMHDFVRDLISFRLDRIERLNPGEYGAAAIAWKNASNIDMTGDEWGRNRHVMLHHYGEADTPELVTLINFESGSVNFTLPEGRDWGRVIDTQSWFDTPADASESGGFLSEDSTRDPYISWNIETVDPELTGASYDVQPFSIVVLEAQ